MPVSLCAAVLSRAAVPIRTTIGRDDGGGNVIKTYAKSPTAHGVFFFFHRVIVFSNLSSTRTPCRIVRIPSHQSRISRWNALRNFVLVFFSFFFLPGCIFSLLFSPFPNTLPVLPALFDHHSSLNRAISRHRSAFRHTLLSRPSPPSSSAVSFVPKKHNNVSAPLRT